MRGIQASDAKTRLPQILDEVERGETVRITRHGRPIARIVPEPHRRQEEIDKGIESIKMLRKHAGKITLDELFSARHEGHKYSYTPSSSTPIDRAPEESAVLALARTHRLSVHDASYLELAQRERLPLATLDLDLRKAARAAGTALLDEQ
jgi:prevent-host-death family protein